MRYAELQVTSNYSFLRGASYPKELIPAAKEAGLAAVAITDRNTLAGIVKAYDVANQNQMRLIIGCRLDLMDGSSVLCYPQDRAAYSRLVRLLTLGKQRAEKGSCHITYEDVAAHGAGQVFVALGDQANDALRGFLERLKGDFPRQTYMALTRRFRPHEMLRLHELATLAQRLRVPTVVTNDVLYHEPGRRILQDVVTCIRLKKTIDTLGHDREWSADRFFKPPTEMWRLFKQYPEAVERTLEIMERCTFSLSELKYQYPDESLEPGMTAQEALEKYTAEGAHRRYPTSLYPNGVPQHVWDKIAYEMKIIKALNYAPYFLTVYRIVQHAISEGILCQGRGSAANSAVCYCLGVTEISPETGILLFERFVSADRGEPPDIDVDFEHERREEVIQWIYKTYGRERAALTATVIHYRSRRAVREVGKALGLPEDVTAGLVSSVWGWSEDGVGEKRARQMGLDAEDWRLRLTLRLSKALIGFPRHLSQHPGGFVITRDRLDDLVPIENASMEDRTVIEWDKDDIETLHMMKVDVLALGMLSCLRKSFEFLRQHKGVAHTIASIPQDDAPTYDMLCKADSVGVFQVESRAQMNMLPRLRPRKLYDLTVEVAIVRPGPIQGNMVHPYIRRRQKLEKVDYPSKELEAVLERTLGVPLFQEQAMQIAIVAAKFTPGEADKLRRAMATFRNDGKVHEFEERFIGGMIENKYPRDFAERCFNQIKGFGTYGFPESHAASFAILVNASAWVKCHHPDAFLCGILNAQPMGFYQPAQLIRDAQEHGVTVLPVDVNASRWDCTLEPDPNGGKYLAARLGFRLIKGFAEESAGKIVAAREHPYRTPQELWRRSGIPASQVERLAESDAFASLGYQRRDATWGAKALRDTPLPLFQAAGARDMFSKPEIPEARVFLPSLTAGGEVMEDYVNLAFSLRAHPLSFLRGKLTRQRWLPLEALKHKQDGDFVHVAGLVLVRQRPGEGNVVFVTLEDENTNANLVVWSTTFERYRVEIMTSNLLGCYGKVQKEGDVIHVVTHELFNLSPWLKEIDADLMVQPPPVLNATPEMQFKSRDFH